MSNDIIKLLDIELQYLPEKDDCEIIVRYGSIVEKDELSELKKQMVKLKEKIVRIIKEELE